MIRSNHCTKEGLLIFAMQAEVVQLNFWIIMKSSNCSIHYHTLSSRNIPYRRYKVFQLSRPIVNWASYSIEFCRGSTPRRADLAIPMIYFGSPNHLIQSLKNGENPCLNIWTLICLIRPIQAHFLSCRIYCMYPSLWSYSLLIFQIIQINVQRPHHTASSPLCLR